MFYNGASVDYVKNDPYYWGTDYAQSTEYGYLSDGSDGPSWEFDADAGTKSPPQVSTCLADAEFGHITDFIHMRVYAPSPSLGGSDHFYSTDWGFYIIASAHWDYSECIASLKYSGNSEDAERYLAQHINTPQNRALGLVVNGEQAFYNYEPYHFEGSQCDSDPAGCHLWNNDGGATFINMPPPIPAPPPPTPIPNPGPGGGGGGGGKI